MMSRLIHSALITAMVGLSTIAFAEDNQVSQADFQVAIEKFGVNSATAQTAAEHAMLTVVSEKATQTDDILVRLPADFLEGSPY